MQFTVGLKLKGKADHFVVDADMVVASRTAVFMDS